MDELYATQQMLAATWAPSVKGAQRQDVDL